MVGRGSSLDLYEVTLDCPEPRELAEFYRRLLGWTYAQDHETTDPAGDDWLVLLPPRGGPRLAFQRSDASCEGGPPALAHFRRRAA
jgi:catechol 2,3-dioxygenase-like lactoylglutathione lyase family enzyme